VRAGIPVRNPGADELPARTAALLHVVYLVFNEGYAATDADTVVRTDLCDEALRLAALLAELRPDDAEVRGLRALLVLHDARRAARTGPDGRLVPLAEQDRSRWDRPAIARGVRMVEDALRTGPVGPYQIEAAIAAVHAEARTYEATDWAQIVALYGLLEQAAPGPMVRLSRAVAVSMRDGPAAGLSHLDALAAEGTLATSHRLPAARAHLLTELGRTGEAALEYDRALALVVSPRERAYLQDRRDQLLRDVGALPLRPRGSA
jgi:RNA polymerase sigma-70 factor (ECF subfamily)